MKLFEKPAKFVSDVSQEMSKVSWPTYEELKGSTIIVVVLSLIFTAYVFSADAILRNIVELIF